MDVKKRHKVKPKLSFLKAKYKRPKWTKKSLRKKISVGVLLLSSKGTANSTHFIHRFSNVWS